MNQVDHLYELQADNTCACSSHEANKGLSQHRHAINLHEAAVPEQMHVIDALHQQIKRDKPPYTMIATQK